MRMLCVCDSFGPRWCSSFTECPTLLNSVQKYIKVIAAGHVMNLCCSQTRFDERTKLVWKDGKIYQTEGENTHTLSLSLSLSIFLFLSLYIWVYLSMSMPLFLFLALSESIFISFYLSMSRPFSLYLSSVSFSFCLSLFHSLSISISLSVFAPYSLCLSLSVSPFLPLSVFVSSFLWVSLPLSFSLSFYVCLSHSLCIVTKLKRRKKLIDIFKFYSSKMPEAFLYKCAEFIRGRP